MGSNATFATTFPSSLNLLRMEEDLSMAHLRLSRVYVENMPYQRLIERFDRPQTFFYIDPPYYNCEDDCGKGIFSRDDFAVLASLLANITGKFIMSMNDTPEIRTLFKDFHIQEVPTTYMAGGAHNKKKVTELLITNHSP
jgi:DNA adenine methylase